MPTVRPTPVSPPPPQEYPPRNILQRSIRFGIPAFLIVAAVLLAFTAPPAAAQSVNHAPTFSAATANRNVNENQPAGTYVGKAVTATDADSDTLSYTLGGPDAAAFTIDSATGQIKLARPLDTESKSSHSVTVSVADGKDGSGNAETAPYPVDDTVTVTIHVNDLNTKTMTALVWKSAFSSKDDKKVEVTVTLWEDPSPPLFDGVHPRYGRTGGGIFPLRLIRGIRGGYLKRNITENVPSGTSVGAPIVAQDPEGGSVTYSMHHPNPIFTIHPSTGQLSTTGIVDYETSGRKESPQAWQLYIRATDSDGQSEVGQVFVTVNNLPGEPAAPANLVVGSAQEGMDVSWNAVAGATGYRVEWRKQMHPVPHLSWRKWGDIPAVFLLAGATSYQIRGLPAGVPYQVRVSAKNAVGYGEVAYDCDDWVNHIPVSIKAAPASAGASGTSKPVRQAPTYKATGVAVEHTDDGKILISWITPVGVDPKTILYDVARRLEDRGPYAFIITGIKDPETDGTVSHTDTDVLTPHSEYHYSVRVTDLAGSPKGPGTQEVCINAPGPPTPPSSKRSAPSNPLGPGTQEVCIHAPEPPTPPSSKRSAPSNPPVSAPATGATGTATDARLTVPTNVQARLQEDGSTLISWDAPAGAGPDVRYDIRRRQAVGGSEFHIIAVKIADADGDGALEYRDAGDDLEAGQAYRYGVRAVDGSGAALRSLWTRGARSSKPGAPVNTGEAENAPVANRAPAFAGASASVSVAEDTAAGAAIAGSPSATDLDTEDTLIYTLGGTDSGHFAIDADSGQLLTGGALDYETTDSYQVTVTATDTRGLTASIAVTITVTNVNEAPAFVAASATVSVAEDTAAGAAIAGSPSATDLDAEDTLIYTLGGTDSGHFAIDADSGQLLTGGALDYETTDSYQVTVTATDTSGLTASIAVTITVTNVNEAPAFAAASATVSVAEDTAAGAAIAGSPSATDLDAEDTLIYTLGGTDSGHFAIDADSGQLLVKDALDYETTDSYSVTVTATDTSGLTASIAVTITVDDVADTETADQDSYQATAIFSRNRVILQWDAVDGATAYGIEKNGQLMPGYSRLTWLYDDAVRGNIQYEYRITAYKNLEDLKALAVMTAATGR